MIVYKIQNLLNNKQYIGITCNCLNKRIYQHIKDKSYIGKSINKNGIENFNVSIIYKAKSLKDLNNKEIELIKKLNTLHPNGYNLDSGGKVKIPSKLTIQKIRKSRKQDKNIELDCQLIKLNNGKIRLRKYQNGKRIELGTFKNKKNAVEYYNYCSKHKKYEKFIYPRISKYKNNKVRLRISVKGNRKTLGIFLTKKQALEFYFKEKYSGNYFYES